MSLSIRMATHQRTASDPIVDAEAIRAAGRLIAPHVRHTPNLSVAPSDFGIRADALILKLEVLQHTGSFKVRGAFANLMMRDIPQAGVVAASGGNHGVAVAFAARRLNIPATVFVPRIASPAKIKLIGELGAHLVIAGDRYAEALAASEAFIRDHGGMPVHAFDQRETLLGQGTIGLELEMDAPEIDTLLVAVGGGGLIGGIAAWYGGRTKIVAVEPELAPTLERALAAGRPVDAAAGGLAADSLAPRRIGALTFPIARRYVDQVVLVTDDEIAGSQRALWDTARVVAEPGGAAAMAALLSGRYRPGPGERVAVLICGANTTAVDFSRT